MRWLVWGLAAAALVGAQEWGTLSGMHDYRQVFDLPDPAVGPPYRVEPLESNAPGNVFWDGDAPRFTFQIENLVDQPLAADGSIEIVRYAAAGRPGDDWWPELRLLERVGRVPLRVDLPPRGWADLTVEPPTPATRGGYALIVDLGPLGRRYLTSYVRTFQPRLERVRHPRQALEEMPPAILERLGVQAVRYGVAYWSSDQPGFDEYQREIAAELRDMHEHRVTCVAEIGAGRHPQPLGRPRPHLDADGVMLDGKSDMVWPASSDADYGRFVRRLCAEFGWPKGPITGIKLWNEPWEGLSISGWGADMLRYRELYRIMAEATIDARRDDGVDVLVGGCDSSTNTWDKLFADGSTDWLRYLDFCSIHYQGLQAPVLYRLWRDRREAGGRVLIWDTESWVANSDDRLAGVVATNRAAGYDRSMGHLSRISISTLSHRRVEMVTVRTADGDRQRPKLIESRPPAAAIGAVQAFIGEREFQRIVFRGKPWVYQFAGRHGDPEDGTIVVLGDLDALFSHAGLYRGVRPQREFDADAPPATLSLPADARYTLHDFYGNPLPPEGGRVIVPLDTRGFFLRGDGRPGSFAALSAAVERASVAGLEPVDIVAHDLLAQVEDGAVLRLDLASQRNAPLTARLGVRLGELTVSAPTTVRLGAREQRRLEIPVRGRPTATNAYPLEVVIDAGPDGLARHDETLHVNLIAQRTIAVDGDLADWVGVTPQVVAADEAGGASFEERMLMPFAPVPAGRAGEAAAWLAWDERAFYFAAKIADDTPHPGAPRFATRDQDADFYPERSWLLEQGERRELLWPAGERRFSYRRWPALPSGYSSVPYDNVLIAFNAIALEDDPDCISHLPGRMPRFVGYPCTDYEYALNQVAAEFGGGTEVWRLAVPGLFRKHFYPRQPANPREGAVADARLVIRHDGSTRVCELSLPWREIPHVRQRLDAGQTVKFSYRVNHDTGGPTLELARGRSTSQRNSLAFHPDWAEHWANELEFAFDGATTTGRRPPPRRR